MTEKKWSLIKKFWKLFKGYWSSEEKWKARGLFVVIVLMNIAVAVISYKFVNWNTNFFGILEKRAFEQFLPSVSEFFILVSAFVLFATYAVYLERVLRIKWRTWMTDRYICDWMKNQAYYRIQVSGKPADNQDQRICEDIDEFTEITIQLLSGAVHMLVSLVIFGVILWQISGVLTLSLAGSSVNISGYIVWGCLIYTIIASFLTHVIGRKLIPLNFEQQRYEADLRFSMMRVRENSESIAFYRGEEVEKKSFHERFKNVISNYRKLIARNRLLDFYKNTYTYVTTIFPIVIVAPIFFPKEISFSGLKVTLPEGMQSFSLGDLMGTVTAITYFQNALNYFVMVYESLARLASVTRRLSELTANIERVIAIKSEIEQIQTPDENFSTEHLQVALPNGKTLLKDCTVEFKQGMSFLITGSSGCGKSTFLRTISGIWPFGKGKIFSSERGGKLFLSQRPYLPLGTLRRAIYYPLEVEINSDEKIKEIMRLVDLEKFVNRLDETDDWSRILSLGEQQRIAFARVLLFKPKWIFLDESTSALDEPCEKMMYDLIKKNLPTAGIVSVGHRSTLFALHDKELHLSNGGWKLSDLAPTKS